MLLCDVNILAGAQRNDETPDARALRVWLTEALNGHESVGISEMVLAAMVRLVTNPRIFAQPATPAEAVTFADAVLDAPAAIVIRPGPRHWSIFADLVRQHRLRANDVPGAYLAAIALESGATLVTRDRDFDRYSVRTLDPLRQ